MSDQEFHVFPEFGIVSDRDGHEMCEFVYMNEHNLVYISNLAIFISDAENNFFTFVDAVRRAFIFWNSLS